MKRLKTAIFGLMLILSTASAPLWAIWEGNAGIAAAGEFPSSGLFARSDMFPKNTIVEIQNLETEITIRAVITGPSGVPGLVAVLSPETASALSVRAGSVSRVRISVPSAVSEAAARGTLSSPTASVNRDPDSNPAAAAAMARIDLETTSADTTAEDLISALGSENSAEELIAAQEPSSMEDAALIADETPEADPAGSDNAVASADATESRASIVDTAPALPAPDSPGSAPAAFAAKEPELPSETPVASPAVLDDPVAESPEVASEKYFAEPELSLPAEAPSEPAIASASKAASIPPKPTAPVAPDASETEVTLVPSAERPPAAPAEKKIAEVPLVPGIAPPVATPSESVPSPVETVRSIPVVPPIRSPAKPAPSASAPESKPVQASPAPIASSQAPAAASGLPFISSFAKGSYYVQIASCSETLNAKKIVDEWGASYPLVVERASGAKGELLKVYVGPVQKDEYGAVLERFRQLGFKDAFVKKAN